MAIRNIVKEGDPILVACHQAGHKAVQHFAAGDLVLVQIDQT